MKIPTRLTIAVAASACLAMAARAHPPSAYIYFAYHTPPGVEMTVDGDLGDWWWFPEPAEITAEYSYVHAGPDIYDPEDFEWKLRVAWSDHENRIYISYEIFDDVFFPYETAGERETYLYDNFSLIVDADHSGGPFQAGDLPDAEDGTQAQLWMFPLGGPTDGYHFVYLHGGATWYDQPPFSEYAYRYLGDNRHAGEISLTLFDRAAQGGPDVSEVHDLQLDEALGLACLYDDHDEEGTTHDGQWKTHESGQGYFDANFISDFLLIPAPPGVAAVESETWGRLKAGTRRDR